MKQVISFCNHEVQCWDDGSIDFCFYEFDAGVREIPMYYISLHHDFVTNNILHLHIFRLGQWLL